MNHNRLFAVVVFCMLFSGSSLFMENPIHYRLRDNYEEWLAINNSYVQENYSLTHYEEIVDQNLTVDEYYRASSTHTLTVEFFVRITGSERIALPMIYYAEQNDIPLPLMFSVSWVESRFKPYAYNLNPTTVDRGLFQLNSASFRSLRLEEFFNPEINALHAGKHLRYCLDKAAGDFSTALAIYNAGLGRVRSGSIPSSTKIYISRVLEYRAQLIRRFDRYMSREIEAIRSTQQS